MRVPADLRRHPPDVGEGLRAGLAAEPAVAGFLDAAKRGLRLVRDGLVVDVGYTDTAEYTPEPFPMIYLERPTSPADDDPEPHNR